MHLQRVAKERNGLFDVSLHLLYCTLHCSTHSQVVVETTQEVDFYRAHQAAGTPAKAALSPEVNMELIEAKKQARHLRDQL